MIRGLLLDSGDALIGPRGGRWNPRFDFEEVVSRHHDVAVSELAGAVDVALEVRNLAAVVFRLAMACRNGTDLSWFPVATDRWR